MKCIKLLGLLVGVAMVATVFAAPASATKITSPPGTLYFGEIHADSVKYLHLHNPIASITCEVTLTGHIEKNGEHHSFPTETTPASGTLTEFTFGICTNNWHVTTVAAGSLSIKSNGNGTGDLFSTGMTIEATRFGITCRYVTNNTTLGTVTSASGGTKAKMHIEASIPFHNGSGLCGSGATGWTGLVEITSPTDVVVN